MPDRSGFQQASLEIEGGTTLECWFNPTQYSISKANEWTARPVVGSSLPRAQFGGGHARELTVDLLFDAGPKGDVTKATDQLFQMMEVDPALATGRRNQARPPTLKLSWGTFMSFKAVCRHLDVQFTVFRADGTASRAFASLPTTRADARLRSHVVREGDSLQSIAFHYYQDATRWPTIAEHNRIDNPLALRRGHRLTIPLESA
jgi:hypothetical protein